MIGGRLRRSSRRGRGPRPRAARAGRTPRASGREDVDDDVEVVHEDPARLGEALDAARQQAVVVLQPLVDPVVDRLGLAVGVAGADDEVVGVADARRAGRARRCRSPSCRRPARRSRRRAARRRQRARLMRAAPPRVEPARARCSRRPRRGRDSGSAGPRRTRRRISRGGDVHPRHLEEANALGRRRGSAGQPLDRSSRRRAPARSATASSASSSIASGSRQRREAARPCRRPTMNVSSSSGVAHAAPAGYRPCRTARPRSSSRRDTPRRSSPATASSAHLERGARRPDRPATSLCGGAATGMSTTRSSPSWSAPPARRRRCAMCGGLNVPPRMPRPRHYRRTCPSPSTRYLNVHSSRSPIGPRAWSFCVELPISAPMPNSPPSVKRVDALT